MIRNAGAFSCDIHLFQTSSWHVPRVLRDSACARTAPAPRQSLLIKITQEIREKLIFCHDIIEEWNKEDHTLT
jgi:hypothetical protein